jgi:hypothetical protein
VIALIILRVPENVERLVASEGLGSVELVSFPTALETIEIV